jgi:hypothetical protein
VKPFVKDQKGDVLEKIVHKKVRSAGKLNPAVSRLFSKIVCRCLRKKAQRRFPTTEKIKRRLERYLRRFPLDHQEILRKYLEDLTPYKPVDNWPPKFWRRACFRLFHLKKRTYLLIFLVFLLVAAIEYGLLSRGKSIEMQWLFMKRCVITISQKIRTGNPGSMDSHESEADTTRVHSLEEVPE